MAAAAPPEGGAILTVALFLLGYGWNLSFVAGSSLLAGGATLAERIRLQGASDMLVWMSSAAAGLASGLLLEIAGYPTLAVVGGVLLVIPVVTLVVARRHMPAAV
jgi:hypothetical protein